MPELQIFNCEQGTPEWLACRAGIPTASEFKAVMTKGRGGAPSEGRSTYMMELLSERLGIFLDSFGGNVHTERGHALEPRARRLYQLMNPERTITQVGFMRRGNAGASPDSLVDRDGLTEIKSKISSKHLKTMMLEKALPAEHVHQVQGQLWISSRSWCDFISYCEGLWPYVIRVQRDEKLIAEMAVAVAEFNQELDALEAEYRRSYEPFLALAA